MPIRLLAAAFLIYNQDAKTNGMGMAAVSSVDNPSAVFYNPALLIKQKGMGFSFGETLIRPDIRYQEPSTGKRYYMKSKIHHIPYIYGKYTGENFSFGIGLFSPFGLSTEWPEGWPGRYNAKSAEIKSTYINPVFAYKVNQYLSVAGGVSYIISSVKMVNDVNLSHLGLSDGSLTLKGDGEAMGYNMALSLNLPHDYTLSLAYRSPSKIIYRGKAKLSLPPFFPSSVTHARSSFTFPFLGIFGIAKKIGSLILECDLLYTGWSSMSHYNITSEDGSVNAHIRKGWLNTPSLALGMNYMLRERVEIRCGYMFDKSPVPKRTMGPELPDSTRHIFTAGGGIRIGFWTIDGGYQITSFENGISNLPEFRGSYKSFAHVGFISLRYNL